MVNYDKTDDALDDSIVHDNVLNTYELMASAYIAEAPKTVQGPMKTWLDTAVHDLPCPNAKILEVGAGSGRDASYLLKRGFKVQCSDAAAPFVDHLKSIGLPARRIDILTDTIGSDYDLIYANAVVCHFTRKQFSHALSSIRQSLVPNGRLAFTTKFGNIYSFNYEERAGMVRPFSSWPKELLRDFVEDHGYLVVFMSVSGSLSTNSNWVNVIAIKD